MSLRQSTHHTQDNEHPGFCLMPQIQLYCRKYRKIFGRVKIISFHTFSTVSNIYATRVCIIDFLPKDANPKYKQKHMAVGHWAARGPTSVPPYVMATILMQISGCWKQHRHYGRHTINTSIVMLSGPCPLLVQGEWDAQVAKCVLMTIGQTHRTSKWKHVSPSLTWRTID